MTIEIPTTNPEKREMLDDNARKFISESISAQFFNDKQVNSFQLVVDWLETDQASEKKLAHKTYNDGSMQILLISKLTQDGNRKTIKEPLTDEQYHELTNQSLLHLEKIRHEFSFIQDGLVFEMKYDVFADKKLHMLEVDAPSENEKSAFSAEHFPVALQEVTGDLDYYGYRICDIL